MSKHQILKLALVGAIALPGHLAFANDTMSTLAAGGIEFKANASVEMKREDLFIDLDQVKVRYEFFNRSKSAIRETVAFPMPQIQSGDSTYNSIDVFFPVYELIENATRLSEPGWDAAGPVAAQISERLASRKLVDFSVKINGKPKRPQMIYLATMPDGKNIAEQLLEEGIPLSGSYLAGWESEPALDRFPKWKERLNALGFLTAHGEPAWTNQVVYYWPDTFEPEKIHRVEHEYSPGFGGQWVEIKERATSLRGVSLAQGRWKWADYCPRDGLLEDMRKRSTSRLWRAMEIQYVLTTGSNWAKPIGKFHLEIQAPKGAEMAFCWEGKPGAPKKTSLVKIDRKDFKPTHNLRVLMLKPESQS